MHRIEYRTLVHTVVTAHAVGVHRAVRSPRAVVAVEAAVALVDAARDWKSFVRVWPRRGLPRGRAVTVTTRLLKRRMPGERAAFEFAGVTARTILGCPGEYGRLAVVTSATRSQRVLAVERKRVTEVCRRPSRTIVAAAALFRIEVHVKGLLGGGVIRLVARKAVVLRDLEV